MKPYVGLMALFIALGILSVASGCAPERSQAALEAAGYKSVEIDGFAWTGCPKESEMRTRFRATNPAGKPVRGAVCCGFESGCEIRF